MERDLELVKFVSNFYDRYSIMFFSENEKEKAEKLKIRVKVDDSTILHLTRNELDDYVTAYRQIYKSFCNIRTFMHPPEIASFDDSYCLSNFNKINKSFSLKLALTKTPKLSVSWVSAEGRVSGSDPISLAYLTERIFPEESLKLIRIKAFSNETDTTTILGLLV